MYHMIYWSFSMDILFKKFLVMSAMFAIVGMILNLGVNGKPQIPKGVIRKPQVPCFFIFGDSLVDNGNNNFLKTLARANFFPYGIDFPKGPTGRFNNGKTAVDVIAELLGFDDFIRPYYFAKGQEIMRGVNYASAAAGIRPETGFQLGDRFSFPQQVDQYKISVAEIAAILGDPKAANNYLNKCLFSIGMGNNDYLNNYFMPDYYNTSKQFTPQQYAQLLMQEYTNQIRVLYEFGARKFAFTGNGQIGCCPHSVAASPDGKTCAAYINNANQIFNSELKAMVDILNREYRDANFTYLNVYGMFEDLMRHPAAHGFTVTNSACCGVGKNGALFSCLPFQIPCFNRSQYIFWDAFHPTEAANIIFGRRSYIALNPTDTYPFDINSLVQS